VAALALVLVSALAGTGLAYWLRAPGGPKEAPVKPLPARLFHGWTKPDLVLVLSGQQWGYVLPCGCSRPQVGGLERRYNFLKLLEKQGWPHVAVDLGDVPQEHGPLHLPNIQGLIKYRYSMLALKEMGYTAVSFGKTETALHGSLFSALGEYALQHQTPRVVSANLQKAEEKFPGMTWPYAVARAGKTGPKVGVTAVAGPTVAGAIKDPDVRFGPSRAALDGVLKAFDNEKVDLGVLLYQGLTTANRMRRPPTEAVACAEAYPQFPVLLCLSEEDEPPANPIWVTNPKAGLRSLIVTVGRKGKCVGVVGVWRSGKAKEPFTFRYQLVELTEDFLTPGDIVNHPIVRLMEDYTTELKKDNYLARYGQVNHPLQADDTLVLDAKGQPIKDSKGSTRPRYVGSFVCRRCHDHAYDVWQKSAHSHAYRTLAEAKRPENRQYDPECIVCHTVGFGYRTGFADAVKTPHLKDVGCESCHGPASLHVSNPSNLEWRRRLNPWKKLSAAKRKDSIDQLCQKCHDVDNDVTWVHGGFDRKWPKIAHPTPKE
jgi:hypothetical protein